MLNLPILSEASLDFPDPSTAANHPNGLLAAGGDLRPERLLAAYEQGIFPWYDKHSPVLWWSPNPRAILWLDDFILHRHLRKIIKQGNFTYSADRHFSEVLNACSQRVDNTTGLIHTWITPELKQSLIKLHAMGYAHSIEIFQNSELIGGLYGVSLGTVFFGESMFHRKSNFSKVALYLLVQRLKTWGFSFIDCQIWSDHLGSLGATQISRDLFLKHLTKNITQPSHIGKWDLE